MSETKLSKEEKHKRLENIRHEAFCKYYLFGYRDPKRKNSFRMGNGTLSYTKAFGFTKGQYASASVLSHELLRNIKVKKRMREMIIDSGFNDEIVDQRLSEIITGGADKDSNVAIKTYNELTKRIDTNPQFIMVDVKKKDSLNKALEYLHGNKPQLRKTS